MSKAEKSEIFDKAKENYDLGFWSKKMLKALVKKKTGGITADEFKEITGEET